MTGQPTESDGSSLPDARWEARSRHLLAAVGVALASSLDYATTIDTVAHLAIGDFAEWCSVDVLSPKGELEKVIVAHADQNRVEWAKEFQAKYPTDLTSNRGLGEVLRTGEAFVLSEVPDEMLALGARSSEHLEELRNIGLGSVIIAPMAARGKVVGAISLVHSEQGRFQQRDVDLAEDLGRLAALAIENSRLFTDAQREIEERRRAEFALQESEARFRELADAMPVMVWVSSDANGVTFTNRYYHEYSGLGAEGRGEGGWANVVHPEDRPAAYATYAASLTERKLWEQELRLRRYDGEYRWHLSRAVPALDDKGEVIRWYGTSTDIHEQRMLSEELERRVEERTSELIGANLEMESFTYSIAHDLRAPLRAIVSTSRILLDEAVERLNEEECRLLGRQEANARRLAELIDALLMLSRVSRHELARTHLDITTMAKSVVHDLGLLETTCEIHIQEDIRAEGDERLVRIVLQNLLDNARKYSPGRCVISVGTEDGAIFVRDEGIGFEMRYAEKLFLPFERLVTGDEFPGTGIGLASVERIVRRHGGRIWAESEIGKGATFFFTLGP